MLWFETALLPRGWASGVRLTVAGGSFATVETDVGANPGDERHGIAVPALCNLHSHAFQRGMAGLAEKRGPAKDDFWSWREVMYHFLDRLTPDDIEAIAGLAYVEMLETGFARVGEFHYLHHDHDGMPYSNVAELATRIVAAASETGIGLTLLPVFYAHSNFGGAAPEIGQRRFVCDLGMFERLLEASRAAISVLPDACVGVAPHSLRATSPEELMNIVSLAEGGPVHIHAAEQVREVEDCIAWSGLRPVQWLLEHAAVGHSWCIVHATHATHDEAGALAKSGAVAGLCPITEANLGDGVFAAESFNHAGGRFGIGTDSNVSISGAGELRMAEYAQRLARRARNLWPTGTDISTGRSLFEGAICGGAQALGQQRVGIETGATADFMSLDCADPCLSGRHGDAILDSWIFANARVDCVWRRGNKLVSAGKHRGRDKIANRYRRTLENLLSG